MLSYGLFKTEPINYKAILPEKLIQKIINKQLKDK